MRLTLRTLLAYMDNLLDTKDSQEIGKKVEESKFATELYHKIRDVMRRLRLAAPSVTEKTPNADSNTIAEYLDNALPAERVPDVEEVCLKSEMHLAEVASCHQILTMVLGEPVEIDPDSRQRMYQLPAVAKRGDEERLAAAEAATALSGDGQPAPPPPPATPVKTKPRPVVPEYLRDPPRKWRILPAAAVMIFIGAAVGLLLLSLGQLNPGTPLGNAWLWVQAKIQGESDSREEPGKTSAKASGSGAASSSGEARPAATSAPPAESVGRTEEAVPKVDPGAGAPVPETPPATVPGTGTAVSPRPAPPDGPNVPPPADGRVAPGQPPATVVPDPGAATVKPPDAAPVQPDLKPADPKAAPTLPPGGKVPGTVPPPAVAPGAGPPAAAEDKTKIARFMSDGQDVLLKQEPSSTNWKRVLPEEFLPAHQPLMGMPYYRPRIAVMDVGATVELVNGTRVEFLPGNSQAPPGIQIDFGRVVIKPLAQAGARLRVEVGAHKSTVTLTNVESVVGIEVVRRRSPGTDPEKVVSRALTRLFLAGGGAVWEEAGKQPVRLTAPAELIVDGAAEDAPTDGLKKAMTWISGSAVNEMSSHQPAALSLAKELRVDCPASMGLMELTDFRQDNVRSLAACGLGYLGQFDPMTAALNDRDFRPYWADHFESLKEAIARGPETAAAIRVSLEKFGAESPALYRMLWGYTDKDLEDGEDVRLVRYLDHESLVFRVLADLNLREITNQTTLYRPEATPAKRTPWVRQWKQQQEANKIRWRAAGAKPAASDVKPPASDTKPTPPAATTPPARIAPEPEPKDNPPGEIKPVSATEPVQAPPPSRVRQPPGSEEPAARPPVVVPEPPAADRRPPVVYPEPAIQ